MTAYTTKGDRERLLKAGFDAYLGKPMRAEELFAALAEATPVQSGSALSTPVPSPRASASARPPSSGPKGAPVLDREAALERVAGDADLYDELVDVFFEECPKWRAEIDAAIAARDAARLRRAAHTVKGAADHCGGRRAHDAALALEATGKDGQIDAARSAATTLSRELARLTEALKSARATKLGKSASPS